MYFIDSLFAKMGDTIYALFKTPETVLRPQDIARTLNIEKRVVNRHLLTLINQKKLSVTRTANGGNPRYSQGNGTTTIEPDEKTTEKSPENDILELFSTPETVLKPFDIAKKLNLEKTETNRYLYNLLMKKKLSVIRTSNGGNPRYFLGDGETITE